VQKFLNKQTAKEREWDMVKEKAAKRGMSAREYLHFLAENDRIPD